MGTMFILSLVAAVLAGAVVLLLAFGVHRAFLTNTGEADFEARLREIGRGEFQEDDESEKKVTWSSYWHSLATRTGAVPSSPESAGRIIMIVMIIAFGVGALVWPGSVIVGAIVAGIVPVIARFWYMFQINKRSKKLDSQLPVLVSHMRATLQANQTPRDSILSVIEDMPYPLRDELEILRSEVNVNIPLETALENLALRVPSREMKFLVSSIGIAIQSGSDLDPQLKIIEEIMGQRARLAQKLAAAVAEVQPSIYLSAVFVPAGFIYSYVSSEVNREFWGSFLGILFIGAVALLYVAGLFLTRKIVNNVENT